MDRKARFTDEQISQLRDDPHVLDVTPYRLRFTLAFRQEIFDAVRDDIRRATISAYLRDHGYPSKLCNQATDTLYHSFQRSGRPVNQGRSATSKLYHHDRADDAILLETGKFEKCRNGIRFTAAFMEELYSAYPERPIEESIRAAGIDPEIVSYQRMAALKRRFDGDMTSPAEPVIHTAEEIDMYSDHPYVRKITAKQLKLSDAFYNDACPLVFLHINEILKIFEIEPSLLSVSARTSLFHRLRHWQGNDQGVAMINEQSVRIQRNISVALMKAVDQMLGELKDMIPRLPCPDRKVLFQLIRELPPDPGRRYTVRYILRQTGVSKTCYYAALANERYGQSHIDREARDQERRRLIQQVLDHRGFRKGYRQVYMMLPGITGIHMGLHTVQRVMRRYNMNPGIRKANRSRRAAKALLERNLRDNLLQRRFRLYGPDEVLESDVTWLYYDHGRKRMYGSACKDPVTRVLMDFSTSERNDYELVARSLDHCACIAGDGNVIYHTDQGALYLMDEFQKRAESHGFRLSMSKRGNCWDNAPQESFFGHFKDEVDLDGCKDPPEVAALVREYMDYYNHERKQWTLGRMTPEEYRQHLLDMTPEEQAARLEKEGQRYRDMKEKARESAVERFKTIGV